MIPHPHGWIPCVSRTSHRWPRPAPPPHPCRAGRWRWRWRAQRARARAGRRVIAAGGPPRQPAKSRQPACVVDAPPRLPSPRLPCRGHPGRLGATPRRADCPRGVGGNSLTRDRTLSRLQAAQVGRVGQLLGRLGAAPATWRGLLRRFGLRTSSSEAPCPPGPGLWLERGRAGGWAAGRRAPQERGSRGGQEHGKVRKPSWNPDRDPDSRNRVCLLNRQTRRGKAERERCRREVREKGVIDVGCSGLRRDCESLHNWGYRYTIGGYTLRSLNIDGKRLRR